GAPVRAELSFVGPSYGGGRGCAAGARTLTAVALPPGKCVRTSELRKRGSSPKLEHGGQGSNPSRIRSLRESPPLRVRRRPAERRRGSPPRSVHPRSRLGCPCRSLRLPDQVMRTAAICSGP